MLRKVHLHWPIKLRSTIPVPLQISDSAIFLHHENKVKGQMLQVNGPKDAFHDSVCAIKLESKSQQRTHRLVSLPWLSKLISQRSHKLERLGTYLLPRVIYLRYLRARALDNCQLSKSKFELLTREYARRC